MVCACIDIGSNTTRVLVAEARSARLAELRSERAFTRLGQGLAPGGSLTPAKIEEVARVVADQRALAEAAGARAVRAVATAAVRAAPNADALVAAVRARAGLALTVLAGEQEARLAFLGATGTAARPLDGLVGVVDVGGGSTEIAVGTVPDGVRWWASCPIGSGSLTQRHVRSDPPSAGELDAMRDDARATLGEADVPAAACALAVGGSATSLRRLVGPVLDAASLQRALAVLAGAPAGEVARRHAIEPQRAALLPAGILILAAAARRLGQPLQIGCGGLREGVLLELVNAMMDPP
jgi:exopolyphosphatase/guanosine-5'-triphosphate,3'-diphosphate pyrophosphatase